MEWVNWRARVCGVPTTYVLWPLLVAVAHASRGLVHTVFVHMDENGIKSAKTVHEGAYFCKCRTSKTNWDDVPDDH